MDPVVSRAGDRALLVDLGADVGAATLHAAAAAARAQPGVVACVVGHQTLYLVFEDSLAVDRWRLADSVVRPTANGRRRTIPVSFADDYALDLPELLAQARITRDALLARLPSISLTARYLGFRGGFAYLDGWPAEWRLPRRERSRNLVRAGSFAIAGAMAGFYPLDLPGGWNILGRTGEPMENAIGVGDEITIAPTLGRAAARPNVGIVGARSSAPDTPVTEPIAEILSPGQLTTIVGARDWSRADHGIPPGGPFDEAMASATGDGPWLECVLVAPRLRFRARRRVGWWGGERLMHPGEILDLGRIPAFRGYISIEGGIAERPFGDTLYAAENAVELRLTPQTRHPGTPIRVMKGPHQAPELPEEWEVTKELNRVGIRMKPLSTINGQLPTTLPSLGMQFGTLQWHADGTLVAMGPDHPVTGGYLQPATVITADLWKLAQLAPGNRVRLLAV